MLKLLLDQPSDNSPYLTARGFGMVIVVALEIVAAIGFEILERENWASVFASMAAIQTLIFAAVYGLLLLTWKAAHLRMITFKTEIMSEHLYVGSTGEMDCQIENPMPWFLCIDGMLWDCSPHLEVASEARSVALPAKSSWKGKFSMLAKYVGSAAVFGQGIVFTDIFHWFRAEYHTEVSREIDVLPKRNLTRNASAYGLKEMIHQLRQRENSDEPESIRPWQQGEIMHHIFWRGYARRQELVVWSPKKNPPKNLLCLIDAGARMRIGDEHHALDSQLIRTVTQIAMCGREFDSLSIIVYDEEQVQKIARHLSYDQALNRLDQWLVGTLRYHLPNDNRPESQKRWRDALVCIWRNYRLYKGVDFSYIKGKERRIDVDGLVKWARADLMQDALNHNQIELASDLSRMHSQRVLDKLIHYWCRMPEQSLLPNQSASKFAACLPEIEKCFQHDASSTMIWFSDFADEISQKSLNFMIRLLSHYQVNGIGMMMKMPVHQLNFNASLGKVRQTNNCQALSRMMTFIG